VLASTLLYAGATAIDEHLLLIYFALLLGCAIRFAVGIGAFSSLLGWRATPENCTPDWSLL
jgi:hypothetical protein